MRIKVRWLTGELSETQAGLLASMKLMVLAVLMAAILPGYATAQSGKELLQQHCMGCHLHVNPDGSQWSRIDYQRKTPEGWLMTISRMETQRGLVLSAEERQTLVKYLADTQGLAPAETQAGRFMLERQLNTVEQHDTPLFGEMCARCHSGARVALQRRNQDEWRKLVGFHLGQFPSIEVHAMARDRDWLGVATKTMVPYLAEKYPLESEAWKQWQQRTRTSLSGDWVIAGKLPGKGDFSATMQVVATGNDGYSLSVEGHYLDGTPLTGKGSAIVYTGFEWRGAVTLDGVPLKQVLMASEQGQRLSGRIYQSNQEALGALFSALRNGSKDRILAVQPAYLKVGETATLKVIGSQLGNKPNLGAGIKVLETKRLSGNEILVTVKADKSATAGKRMLGSGGSDDSATLTVYNAVNAVEVQPGNSIARVGDAGGNIERVKTAYRAIGIDAGVDGKLGSEDDIRIGELPATWSVKAFDEIAKHDQDVKFAGTMDASSGIFTPAEAGMNPERKFQTNNAGNLTVVAAVRDGDHTVIGEGHLIVTVQRFNNPPIR